MGKQTPNHQSIKKASEPGGETCREITTTSSTLVVGEVFFCEKNEQKTAKKPFSDRFGRLFGREKIFFFAFFGKKIRTLHPHPTGIILYYARCQSFAPRIEYNTFTHKQFRQISSGNVLPPEAGCYTCGKGCGYR